MQEEQIYFRNTNDLKEILKKNPCFVSIYFKKEVIENKTIVSLSKGTGDELYLLSNMEYSNMAKYLSRKNEIMKIEKRSESEHNNIPKEDIKKLKQQNLFSFFTKKSE